MDQENESNSLTRELKAGMRKEKIVHHLRTNQKRIITVLSIAILAALIWSGWTLFNKIQSEKYSAMLHEAMVENRGGDLESSLDILQEISESSAPKGVKSIASLQYAGGLFQTGEAEKSIEVYLAINKNKNFDQYVREYAGLAVLKIMTNNMTRGADKEKFYSLADDLEKNSRALKYHIIEQKGYFEWRLENFDEANKLFSNLIKNPEVSDMIAKRSEEMVEIYNSRFPERDEQETIEISKDKKLEEK
ncbi:MAG: hypothetical protein ACJAZX_000036 [Rickettsiales bacterium]|jgi:hypothetical protein